MEEKKLSNFFAAYLDKEALFLNKKVLQSNYTPNDIKHRDDQIKVIRDILAPCVKLDKPSNLFVYGKTGTGKTLSVRFVVNELKNFADQNGINIKVCYLNCKLKKVADTEYRLIAQIARELGKDIPATGLPTDEVYKIFFNTINNKNQLLILILDEIDQLVKKAGDEILYNLTRINSELVDSQITLVGISNDLVFIDNIDPRAKSSLSEEEIIFPPYNALQIQDILRERSKQAFVENVVVDGVIEKCAAYAAREHGDARRALELLRVAGEVAERSDSPDVKIEHIDLAEEKIEKDRVVDIVSTQPKQHQATLYSIIEIQKQKGEGQIMFTGEAYGVYTQICQRIGLRPLTQRRVSDVISELDMLGILNAKVISKGRYGRTREICFALPPSVQEKINNVLKDSLDV